MTHLLGQSLALQNQTNKQLDFKGLGMVTDDIQHMVISFGLKIECQHEITRRPDNQQVYLSSNK